ncbi:MAG: hypothetical protein IIA89_13060 [Chloroflexi bacterium]|nr:hypothetical protein [Chloroflexota bacterium]
MADKVSSNSRDRVLALLSGERGGSRPCSSGLMNVTVAGLESAGLTFGEVHTDPAKMAAAAETTYRLFGFESAVVPMDLCVEAGALGAEVDFRLDAPRAEFPMIREPLADSVEDFTLEVPSELASRGRIPVVVEAIQKLKAGVGQEIVVGAWVPGPLTLAMQIVELTNLTGGIGARAGGREALAGCARRCLGRGWHGLQRGRCRHPYRARDGRLARVHRSTGV